MHNTNMLRQDETGGRRALAFVTAAAAFLTTKARAQSDAREDALILRFGAALEAADAALDAANDAANAARDAAVEAAWDAYDAATEPARAAYEAALTEAAFVSPAAAGEAIARRMAAWEAAHEAAAPAREAAWEAAWEAAREAGKAAREAWAAARDAALEAHEAARLGLDIELVAKARGCVGESAETLATIVREFPDYQKHTMEIWLSNIGEVQESLISVIEAMGWSDPVLDLCGEADDFASLLRALRRGDFEFADGFMMATKAAIHLQRQLRNPR